MNRHSKGPWWDAPVELEGTDQCGLTILSDNDEVICDLYEHTGPSLEIYPNDRANACLIAAAPDMLAALNIALHDYTLNDSAARVVEAAIAKATGEIAR